VCLYPQTPISLGEHPLIPLTHPKKKGERMRKRNIDKHIWLSYDEAAELRRKSEMACMSESSLIRLLIKGYEPKEKPDERFYDVMRELSAIGNNLNQIAVKANAIGLVDAAFIKEESLRWHQFQADIERVFLRPGKSELKWQ